MYCSWRLWYEIQVAGCMFFFFNDTATTEIYTLSLRDALPIYTLQGVTLGVRHELEFRHLARAPVRHTHLGAAVEDRKSTRLNSSHKPISYAVFCLKKKRPPINIATMALISAHVCTCTTLCCISHVSSSTPNY